MDAIAVQPGCQLCAARALDAVVWPKGLVATIPIDDLARTAEFAAGLGNVERIEVLPFHQMGRFKWQRLGLDYRLNDTTPPSAQLTEQACEVVRKAGLKAVAG